MTHKDKGNYSGKHPQQSIMDENLKRVIMEISREGKITCGNAEKIALTNDLPLNAIGMTIDLLNIDIIQCQLGLFGCQPENKTVRPAGEVKPELRDVITAHLADGRLPCQAAWKIATAGKISRRHVADACEAMSVKIKPCQLGAF